MSHLLTLLYLFELTNNEIIIQISNILRQSLIRNVYIWQPYTHGYNAVPVMLMFHLSDSHMMKSVDKWFTGLHSSKK